MILVTKPLTGDEEVRLAEEVLRSGWLTQGPKASVFEEAVARYVGAKAPSARSATRNCSSPAPRSGATP